MGRIEQVGDISLSAPPSLWKRSVAWSQQLGHIFRWLPAACCTRSLLVYSCFKAGFWRDRSCTFENSFRSALLLFQTSHLFFETRPPISLKIWRSRAFIVFGNVFCRSAATFYFDVLVLSCPLVKDWPDSVQTSKTDHSFKLAPFRSPLTDLIDFGMAGKLLTSATQRCPSFVDSVSRIWIKPKKSLIGCWAPTATTFGQSPPSQVQLTAGRNGHNRLFVRPSLVSSVCCVYEKNWAVRVVGRVSAVKPAGFAYRGAISRVIAKVTSSSDLEKIHVRSNLRVDKLADFNDGVLFERSTNSFERVNLNSAL